MDNSHRQGELHNMAWTYITAVLDAAQRSLGIRTKKLQQTQWGGGSTNYFAAVPGAWREGGSIKSYQNILITNTITLNTTTSRYVYEVEVVLQNKLTIVDSGCTIHFLRFDSYYTHVQKCPPGASVKLLNNMIMEPLYTALLDMPNIPLAVHQYHSFPDMCNKALL